MKKTFVVETSMTVATGKVGALMIITPAAKNVQLHDIIISNSAGPVAVNLLEDYSYVEVAKSAVTPVDANRILDEASDVVIWAYPDVAAVAGGSALTVAQMTLVAATSRERLGTKPINLKQSASYLLAFTNTNAGNSIINFALSWEE